MEYNTYKLGNGLRVIPRPSDSPVLYCGYEINAGTRDEEPGEEGLAHFCEHVTFKGTARRKPFQISNYLESVGGDLNAFTNKEDTVYYAAILKEHLERAVDLLSDIVFHSVYPQAEIEKEVEVICDEIESYNDSPSELIYDDFENLIFDGHPLGHNILGTAQRVRSYTTADALRFANHFYTPSNSIFFAYGNIDFQRLLRLLEKYTANIPASRKEVAKKIIKATSQGKLGQTIVRNRHTHQAHVMLGTQGYDIRDERRTALYLLNNMLGGPGMNTRLNLALRERHGLVYAVDSSMVSYGDTGLWCTYFGCDAKDVDRCLQLVHKELDEMGKKELSEFKVNMAKKQVKGQIGVACDNRESFALDFGKSFLHYGWERDITSLYARIDAITPKQLQEVAQDIFNHNRITTLIYR